MLRQFALEGIYNVRLYSLAGCGFVPLDKPIRMHAESCALSHRQIIASLKQVIVPGDVVFLPSLRVPRYKEVWGAAGPMKAAREGSASIEELRAEAALEAETIIASLTERGAKVVFEAPKPIFKTPPFRCSDWFNAKNSVCSDGFDMDRRELEELRRPILQTMLALANHLTNVTIWDPFPVLCPDEVCHEFQGKKPLYFDADHISGYSNDLLFKSFDNHIKSLASAS